MNQAEVLQRVAHIKSMTKLPIGVGFGIRDGAIARAVCATADAAIIGTKMIQVLEDGPPEGAAVRAAEFVAAVRTALDQR